MNIVLPLFLLLWYHRAPSVFLWRASKPRIRGRWNSFLELWAF